MARPRIEINWDDFDKLCGMQCTLEEISSFFGCSEDTIERAVKREYNIGYADHWKQKAKKGHISLRRKMFEAVQKGNITMMIWLSKNWLNYSDKVEQKNDNNNTGSVSLNVTPSELKAAIDKAESEF